MKLQCPITPLSKSLVPPGSCTLSCDPDKTELYTYIMKNDLLLKMTINKYFILYAHISCTCILKQNIYDISKNYTSCYVIKILETNDCLTRECHIILRCNFLQ